MKKQRKSGEHRDTLYISVVSCPQHDCLPHTESTLLEKRVPKGFFGCPHKMSFLVPGRTQGFEKDDQNGVLQRVLLWGKPNNPVRKEKVLSRT